MSAKISVSAKITGLFIRCPSSIPSRDGLGREGSVNTSAADSEPRTAVLFFKRGKRGDSPNTCQHGAIFMTKQQSPSRVYVKRSAGHLLCFSEKEQGAGQDLEDGTF